MVIRKSLISLAAVGMVFGSTAAVAAPASHARASSAVGKHENLAGVGTFGVLLGLLVVAGVIAIIATDHSHKPVSP